AEPAKPEPPVVGLGIAAGARRPGAKKAAKAAPAAPAPAAPAAEAAPEPAAEKPAEAPAEPAKPEPPVVGLGIKPGAKRPGKR
ncbi:putative Fe-S oxidoreductase, partial [Mycolicibacterium fortuitum subsp. fortuitum DSM 46621 = ATCC 6841 = JCM 6387]